jgi:hypothetical protein
MSHMLHKEHLIKLSSGLYSIFLTLYSQLSYLSQLRDTAVELHDTSLPWSESGHEISRPPKQIYIARGQHSTRIERTMASNDDMGELCPQEPGVPDIFGQHAVKKELADDHDASLTTMDHLPPGNPDPEHGTAVKVEKRHDEREPTMYIQELTASAQDETSDSRQNPAVPQEELPGITSGRTEYTTIGSQVPTQATQDEHVDTLALDAPSAHACNKNETSHAAIPESGQKERTGQNAQTTPLDSAMQNDELLVGTSEAPRGGPHMLSDSVAVYNQERQEKEVDVGEAQTVDKPDAAMSDNTDTWANDQSEGEGDPQPGRRPESSGQADPVRRTKRSRDEASDGSDHEGEGEMSVDDDFEDESGASEDSDQDVEDEHELEMAALRAKIAKTKLALQQQQELSQGGTGFQNRPDNGGRQPRMHGNDGAGFNGYHSAMQYGAYDPRAFHSAYSSCNPPFQVQQQGLPYRQTIQPPRHQDRPMGNSYLQGQMYAPPAAAVMPELYSSPGSGYQQHLSLGHMGYQVANYPSQTYGDPSLHGGYQQYPVSPFETQARSSAAPSSNRRPQNTPVAPPRRGAQSRKRQQAEDPEESDSTDDYEPLRTRAPRHRSIHGESDMGSLPPALNTQKKAKQQDKGNNSDVEFVSTKPSMGFKASKSKKAAPNQAVAPQPPRTPNKPTAEQDASSSLSPIDWKLPTYEATFEPAPTKEDIPLAKVSIPGLVREELLLAPDHAEQEVYLLFNVFLPAQAALAKPDEQPAVAVLNFHTIAVMVIEAYIQFEIGDEFGTGRGHWHSEHDAGDEEYVRLRKAKDADTDEIYFAVVDRWRAGLASHKEPAKLIRGVQEFHDVALDVLFYIKEHGLLASEKIKEDEKRRKKAGEVGKTDEKRGAQKVVSTPRVRKKAKPAAKEPEKKKRKKASTAAVTVLKKK